MDDQIIKDEEIVIEDDLAEEENIEAIDPENIQIPDFASGLESLFSGSGGADFKPVLEMQSKILEQQDKNIAFVNSNLEDLREIINKYSSVLRLLITASIINFIGLIAVLIFK